MSEVTGVVQKVSSKDINTKKGLSTIYSFNVDGDWYKTGFEDPQVKEGYRVKFEYEETQYGREVRMPTFKKKAGEAPAVSSGKPAATVSKKAPPEDFEARAKYWEQKEVNDLIRQNTISYQAATNSAIEIVKEALAQGGVPLGNSKPKKLGLLTDAVLEVADQLYGQYLLADDRAEDLKNNALSGVADEEPEVPAQVDDSVPEDNTSEEDEGEWD